jgi:hypothetical protein
MNSELMKSGKVAAPSVLQSLAPQRDPGAETSVSVVETFAANTGFSRRIPVACRGFVSFPLSVIGPGEVDAQEC